MTAGRDVHRLYWAVGEARRLRTAPEGREPRRAVQPPESIEAELVAEVPGLSPP